MFHSSQVVPAGFLSWLVHCSTYSSHTCAICNSCVRGGCRSVKQGMRCDSPVGNMAFVANPSKIVRSRWARPATTKANAKSISPRLSQVGRKYLHWSGSTDSPPPSPRLTLRVVKRTIVRFCVLQKVKGRLCALLALAVHYSLAADEDLQVADGRISGSRDNSSPPACLSECHGSGTLRAPVSPADRR